MKKFLLLILIVGFIFVGCNTTPRNYLRTPFQNKSYVIGFKNSAPVGSLILSNEMYLKVCWEYWNGIFFGWQTTCDEKVNRFKEELIYSGRAGNVIRVAYREFTEDLARPAFFQELNYDLGSSDLIVFRLYKIKILDANNEHVLFIVESDK